MDVIGRDDELRSLDASLDRPAAGGLAALVLEGEAGIGKSTLWLAGVEAARKRGLRVLSSRPAELEAGVAYAGLGDLLENALPEVGSELAEPRRRALEVALLVRDRADVPVDFRTLAVAVRSALDMLAEREPILVAIDDVQWLDASSTHALAFALRRLPGVNIRLLLARRIGKAIPVSELEHAVGDHVERLHVGPLSVGGLHQLLQRRLGRVFARPTLLRLHETSGGNPFYALELARALGADADPTQPLPVPETLEALVRARLDRLPDGTREALLLACAHGRLPAAHLSEAALEPAFVDGAIELEDAAVRFTHPLLASVLYQHASLAARRRAHGQLVEMVDDPLARVRHRALAAPSLTPLSPVRSTRRPASRSPAGPRSPRPSSGSSRSPRRPRTQPRIDTGELLQPLAPISRRAKEPARASSLTSWLLEPRRARRAARRSRFCPSS